MRQISRFAGFSCREGSKSNDTWTLCDTTWNLLHRSKTPFKRPPLVRWGGLPAAQPRPLGGGRTPF